MEMHYLREHRLFAYVYFFLFSLMSGQIIKEIEFLKRYTLTVSVDSKGKPFETQHERSYTVLSNCLTVAFWTKCHSGPPTTIVPFISQGVPRDHCVLTALTNWRAQKPHTWIPASLHVLSALQEALEDLWQPASPFFSRDEWWQPGWAQPCGPLGPSRALAIFLHLSPFLSPSPSLLPPCHYCPKLVHTCRCIKQVTFPLAVTLYRRWM